MGSEAKFSDVADRSRFLRGAGGDVFLRLEGQREGFLLGSRFAASASASFGAPEVGCTME